MVIVIALVIVTALVIRGTHRLVDKVNTEIDHINGEVD